MTTKQPAPADERRDLYPWTVREIEQALIVWGALSGTTIPREAANQRLAYLLRVREELQREGNTDATTTRKP